MENFDPYHWDSSFYPNDCSQTNFAIFNGMENVKTGLYVSYLVFVLFTAYIYGRHKGLSRLHRPKAPFLKYLDAKTRFFELTSQIWFVLSTFAFPWILCIIWLFYAAHYDDIHYLNNYNPWILPFVIIYGLYSIVALFSFANYTDYRYDHCAQFSIKITFLFSACFFIFALYVLIKSAPNLSQFSFEAFYGNQVIHCFDFNRHKNPTLFLIFIILYCFITHHLFVIIRAITAKFCHRYYISKRVDFTSRKRRKISPIQKARPGGVRAVAYIGNNYGAKYRYDEQNDTDHGQTDTDRELHGDTDTDHDIEHMQHEYDGVDGYDMSAEEENQCVNYYEVKGESKILNVCKISSPKVDMAASERRQRRGPPQFSLVPSIDPSAVVSCFDIGNPPQSVCPQPGSVKQLGPGVYV